MNPRPPGYEPDELPGCSTPRRWIHQSVNPKILKIKEHPSKDSTSLAEAGPAGEGGLHPATQSFTNGVKALFLVVQRASEGAHCSNLPPSGQAAPRALLMPHD